MTTADDRVDYGVFRILRRDDGSLWTLGRGGMGVTYRAVNTTLDSPVALKVIDLANGIRPEDEKRFVCEARAMAGLRHKHIASAYHLAREEGQIFYAMELINGDSAQEFVERCGPLAVEPALRLASQVCQALAVAEKQRLVHRDVKPANIMILADADEDEWPFAKLIDFGLVRSLAAAHEGSYATLPGFVGTAQFASPEQIREEPVDARADIYSLGCTLWYLLTGKPPFEGSMAHVFSQHLHEDPAWDKLRSFPKPVVRILRGAMQKDPARRPDAAQLRREIDECLAQLAQPARSPSRSWSEGWMPRLGLAAACLAVLLFLAFGPGARNSQNPATKQEAMIAAQPTLPEPIPSWEYLASSYPPMELLDSTRTMELAKIPVPELGVPGGNTWLEGGLDQPPAANPFAGEWTLDDPALLAATKDMEPAPEAVPEVRKPARRVAEERKESFSPRREIDRARRTVEQTIRRFF
jgi:serine/threonine protein kinase